MYPMELFMLKQIKCKLLKKKFGFYGITIKNLLFIEISGLETSVRKIIVCFEIYFFFFFYQPLTRFTLFNYLHRHIT